jgi:hypothetical protein
MILLEELDGTYNHPFPASVLHYLHIYQQLQYFMCVVPNISSIVVNKWIAWC